MLKDNLIKVINNVGIHNVIEQVEDIADIISDRSRTTDATALILNPETNAIDPKTGNILDSESPIIVRVIQRVMKTSSPESRDLIYKELLSICRTLIISLDQKKAIVRHGPVKVHKTDEIYFKEIFIGWTIIFEAIVLPVEKVTD